MNSGYEDPLCVARGCFLRRMGFPFDVFRRPHRQRLVPTRPWGTSRAKNTQANMRSGSFAQEQLERRKNLCRYTFEEVLPAKGSS